MNFEPIRDRIRTTLVEETLPSLSVAVSRQGEVLWEEAFGWADRERRILATSHTLYSLASISKPMTATGVMVLRERGLLDPDRPVNDYLGAAKLLARVGQAADATVRRVADHTSGLPLHHHFFYADEPECRPSMDETLRRYGNLVTPPGERFQYSNLGYGVLDYVIRRLSGKLYADFMHEEVFLPLGMTRASVEVAPSLAQYAAIRYGGDGVPYPHYDFDHPGGSAVYCSAHDLLAFGRFHLGEQLPGQKAILSPETRAEMQAVTAHREPGDYGFGWNVQTDEHGRHTVSHSGGMGGVSTLLKLVPSEKIAVVTLANAACRLPHTIAEDILAALLPDYGARLTAKREADAVRPAPESAAEFSGDPRLRGEWSGAVVVPDGERAIALRFRRGRDLHVRLGAGFWSLVNDLQFRNDCLTGRFLGDLGTPDASRRPHHLHLDLRLRGRALNGALIARTEIVGASGGAPGRRMGDALSHWMEVRRT